MKNSKVMVVSFIKLLDCGYQFQKWPNHITLVHWFETTDISKLVNDMKGIFNGELGIEYETGDVDYFGPKKDIKVTRIEENANLDVLHRKLVKLAKENDPKFKETYKTFVPHITHIEEPTPQKGTSEIINKIYVVKSNIDTNVKKVICKVT